MRGLEFSRRAVLAGSAALALLGTGISAAYAQSITDRVLKEGKITIGIHNRSPWGFKAEDGSATGFHPDLVKAVLGPLGVKNVDFVIIDWQALLPSLLSKRIDAVATGMQITQQRCETVIFSNPDLAIKDGLAVRPGNPHNIHSLADAAKNPALHLGILRGSSEVERAVKAGVPRDRILLLPDYSALVSAMLGDRIEAAILPPASVNELLKDPNLKGKLERAVPYVGLVENGREFAGYQAVVFRQEDSQLRDLYNESLAKRKAEGTVKSIAERYGFTAGDIAPDDRTAKDMCGANYR
ncbi:ectoine/hydroxyectoine ABC transporter substrate-binding protein EhuB [Bradyrhizobium sp. ERR14]|uniref:ectoine/hydroxyectoine ABC transporter substrate-binding protein EhuB n=1 Tax=Bradyrhizobium sp. ERR14 TaxID=2663837 RepID=UPI001618A9C4|nr:ectoine/hydroxyectoine ABC transporter substrate-binding protein EhuB [Bradyrhizobium sp. ERR14]MBB4398507.1 polar amino acid transport system substrate-binding protein [Bradyrhizobium sp. ERR14]